MLAWGRFHFQSNEKWDSSPRSSFASCSCDAEAQPEVFPRAGFDSSGRNSMIGKDKGHTAHGHNWKYRMKWGVVKKDPDFAARGTWLPICTLPFALCANPS